MKKQSILGLIVGLVFLGNSLMPTQAQNPNGNVKDLSYFQQLKQINRTQIISPEASPDPKLERAIIRENPDYARLANTFSEYPRYFYNRVDLNGDNRPEVLVHLTGPYFCGSGGCTTLIFQSVGQNYRLVSEISVSTAPVIVTNQKSFGWNDLIIVAAGGSWGSNQGYYLLKFNGRNYPNNTGDGTKLGRNLIMTGRAFFANLDYNNGGTALRPQSSKIMAGKSSSGQQRVKGREPSSSRRTTNTQLRNSDASLVTAIRNVVGLENREFFAQMEYFFTKVDLNNDRNKEVIVYTVGALCGAWECPVYIFTKGGTGYRWIGTIVSQSNDAQIAVLSTRSKGWLDIATLVYDPEQRKSNWKLNKFNGTTYENTYQNLSSMPGQIVLRPKGSGISLAEPGI